MRWKTSHGSGDQFFGQKDQLEKLIRKVILEDIRVLSLGMTGQSYVGKVVVMCAVRNWLGCGINVCGYCNDRIKGGCEVGFN